MAYSKCLLNSDGLAELWPEPGAEGWSCPGGWKPWRPRLISVHSGVPVDLASRTPGLGSPCGRVHTLTCPRGVCRSPCFPREPPGGCASRRGPALPRLHATSGHLVSCFTSSLHPLTLPESFSPFFGAVRKLGRNQENSLGPRAD